MAVKTPYPGGERVLQPLSPLSKKDEILALLEAHGIAVEVHTNREPEYADGFLANIRGFLDGTVFAAAAFGPDHWVASQTFRADSLPRTREEALAGMRLHAEHRRMVESPGGRIELANWDPAKNVVFRW